MLASALCFPGIALFALGSNHLVHTQTPHTRKIRGDVESRKKGASQKGLIISALFLSFSHLLSHTPKQCSDTKNNGVILATNLRAFLDFGDARNSHGQFVYAKAFVFFFHSIVSGYWSFREELPPCLQSFIVFLLFGSILVPIGRRVQEWVVAGLRVMDCTQFRDQLFFLHTNNGCMREDQQPCGD